ncbi:hypothetical protein N6L24_02810 [Cognatishimia sp. SS12]|nr:hypothetical protein [Cognatishimia sp. SS12]MDC0737200.1 hypothetical protein [Cognatishimia sp. SS12]
MAVENGRQPPKMEKICRLVDFFFPNIAQMAWETDFNENQAQFSR